MSHLEEDKPIPNEEKNNELYLEKVKTMFGLSSEDKFVNRFSCYIIGIVTLPGWLYITTLHICFHASLPKAKRGPRKAGYLTKKNHALSYRYYFELSSHVLSWYESIESKYLPLKSIDLVHVMQIEPYKKFGIRLQTDKDRFVFVADSKVSQKEWLDEMKRGIFLAQHAGNQINIVLSWNQVLSVEKPMVFQFAENIKIKAAEDDINVAYQSIINTWKRIPERQQQPTPVSSFLSFDSFLNNISLAAFPTIFMNRFMNPRYQKEEEEEEMNSKKSATRSQRSDSLSTLKNLITPTYLYNKLNPQDIPNEDSKQAKHRRGSSLGSALFSYGNRPWSFLSERGHINEAWISQSLANIIEKDSIAEKPLDLWQKEQVSANETLNDQFPMLLNLENVEAATHAEYKEWVESYDIEFRSIGGDPGDLMKLCIDNSFLSVSFIREGTKFFYNWLEDLMVSAYEACQGTDILIESPSAMIGVHIAEKLGKFTTSSQELELILLLEIPFFRSMPFPFSRTSKFPHPFASQSTAGGRIYNDMTYVMIDLALWTGTSRYINRFRRNILHLPSTTLDRLELDHVPYLYSFSSSVIHPPKDWPDYIHVTGYWFLEDTREWTPSADLLQFLEAQDPRPIVYIGFGSIIVPDPAETTEIVVQAVLKSKVRAIICKGWSGRHQEEDRSALLDQHAGTIYHCSSVPHSWLFERIQGVVHHGGAGTTAAGLRAGLPTIIKPFFGDQRFWGQHVEELKMGVCIVKLTAEALTQALETITQNKAIVAKAKMIGETIRKVYKKLKFFIY
ncbi:Sterol 3-beta-glucosyltransferase [Rhizopus stolonifer]|uniref:sterol 3beta-glucosyltransferase n=1 Tax=Rhizopus stolonifer TaxID=4846 RepID=A0A367KIQ4_RHIST|nr:Sterol 3-beta-glucosyltransferase [Rhizopus stolonifer]